MLLIDPWPFLVQNGGKQQGYPARPSQNTNTEGNDRLETSEQNDMNVWHTPNGMTEEEGTRPEEDDTYNTQSLSGNSSCEQGPENQKQNNNSSSERITAGQSGGTELIPVSESTGVPLQGSGNQGNGNPGNVVSPNGSIGSNNGGNNIGNSGSPGGSRGNSAGGNQGSGTQSQGAVTSPLIGVAVVSNGGSNIGAGIPGANGGSSGSPAGVVSNGGSNIGAGIPGTNSGSPGSPAGVVSNGGFNIGAGIPGANSGSSGSPTGNAAGIPANPGQQAGRIKPSVRSPTTLM